MTQKITPYVWHHFWLGLLIMLAGWGIWMEHPNTGSSIAVFGLMVIADDLLEHIAGWSPLRWIYERIYRYIP